ncbi:MAG TPA: hypothetical protein VGQ58_05730 [Candidatus Limnocylindrales bacterium]|nr:hypothetical protein [Candidatus Limnocylindrales bacterium]
MTASDADPAYARMASEVVYRLAAGDTRTEAIRALRRRISDGVFRRTRHDEAAPGRTTRRSRGRGLT